MSDNIRYWMSRWKEDVTGPDRTAGSPWPLFLAGNVTDLPCAEYDGPIPERGQTVQGKVKASFSYPGAKVSWISVYLRAEIVGDASL
jgi:hypothetical protein